MGASSSCPIALLALVVACDEAAKPTSVERDRVPKSAALPPPSAKPPAPEGCARTGIIDGIENDAACAIARTTDDVNRPALKQAKMQLEIEPTTLDAGGAAVLRLAIINTGPTEALFVFDAQPRASGPRVDWSRIQGVPDVKPTAPETPRLLFTMTTLDSHDRNVDAPPTIANSIDASPTSLVGVRVKPGGRLTHTFNWWALKIPPPAPVFKDDAGHRYYPKTSAIPLLPGEYQIVVEVPLHGIPTPERVVATRVKVEKPEKPKKN